MPITVADILPGYADSRDSTFTPSAAANDLLVLLRGTDDDGDSNWRDPTASTGVGTWTRHATIAQSSSNSSANAWSAPVTTTGTKTITSPYSGSGDNGSCLFLLRGIDLTDPVADIATAAADNTESLTVPSMTAPVSGCLLVAVWGCREPGTLTVPTSMTSAMSWRGGGCGRVAYQGLPAAGATGPRSSALERYDESMSAAAVLFRPAATTAEPSGPEPGRHLLTI